jgi:hypothetical protein
MSRDRTKVTDKEDGDARLVTGDAVIDSSPSNCFECVEVVCHVNTPVVDDGSSSELWIRPRST